MSNFRVSRQASEPVFKQIAGHLRGQIAAGQMRYGEVIPPEREMSESLHVSRMTLRAAIDELVREGLLVRVTYVGNSILKLEVAQ